MNQLKGKRLYKNVWQCVRDVYVNEGFKAFYKGFTPFCLTLIPWA